MKNVKKIFYACLLSICVLFSSTSIPMIVHAEDSVVDSRASYIISYATQLSISDTGVASVTGNVRGKSTVTSSYVKCTLQISIGGGWVDVKSWEASSTSSGATVAQTYQLSSRGTYRVYMECRANTEEKTATSTYQTY